MARHAILARCSGSSRPTGWIVTLGLRAALLLVVAACIGVASVSRLTVSYDLASFLPEASTPGQEILKERFGLGPGAQLVYAVLPDASSATAEAVAEELRRIPLVRRVLPETDELGVAAIPPIIWRSQFLLADLPVDQNAWHRVLEDRLVDATIADEQVMDLIAADPLFATVNPLASISAGAPRYEYANERYLILVTDASAFDVGAQSQLVAAMRETAVGAGVPHAQFYGVGVYSTDLQAAVKFEATLFSVLAACGLTCLLLGWFRSPVVLAAIAAPILVGTAMGVCAVTLVYGEIHGIALAFGFTLLGVAVDYPLHTFSHPGHPEMVWPTLRIGVVSTMIAYAVFLFGGTEGLAQLGLFAITGIASAALGTAWMGSGKASPIKFRDTRTGRHPVSGEMQLAHWPWISVLVLAALLLRPSFSNDLSVLTPLPSDILAADAELRERMDASDVRHLVAVRDENLEAVLQRTETVAARLDGPLEAGMLDGYQHIAQLLPSHATQERRLAGVRSFIAAGGTGSGTAFARAASNLNYTQDAFAPFNDRAARALASRETLTRDDMREDRDLSAFVDAHLYETNGVWKSLVFLRGMADTRAVAEVLEDLENVDLLDLKAASKSLMDDFRQRLLRVLGGSLIVIAVALYFITRNVRRSVWIFGTVAAAMALAVNGTAYLRDAVSPFDLMSLALVAGLGLDYGLFFSKALRDRQDAKATARALLICALSSMLVFGILSTSSIPVLNGIGSTVAVGVLAAYLLARFGQRRQTTDVP